MRQDSLFDFRVGERTRELLEDFEVIATIQYMALIPRLNDFGNLRTNVHAAVVASTLRLSSLDYTRRRYVSQLDDDTHEGSAPIAYIEAYVAAKAYVSRFVAKLRTSGRPEPTVGVFGASVVLERLMPSFFCAHFLYRMGHKYEGHAVARLILEQVAWAYAAHQSDDLTLVESIETTRAVGVLKTFVPEVGRLYGFLSSKTHIDYSSHMEFLRVNHGQNVILHARPDYDEYAEVILRLADLFGLVWETSQADYIDDLETITKSRDSGLYIPKVDRPFLAEMKKHSDRLAELQSKSSP